MNRVTFLGRLERHPGKDAIMFRRSERFFNRHGSMSGAQMLYALVIEDKRLAGIIELPHDTPCLVVGNLDSDADGNRIHVTDIAWID